MNIHGNQSIASFFWACSIFMLSSCDAGSTVVINGVNYSSNNIYIGAPDAVRGSGVEESKQYPLDTFSQLVSEISADIVLSKGKTAQIRLTGDDNIIPLIKATSSHGLLTIEASRNYQSKQKLKLEIVTPSLSSVKLNGSGDIRLVDIKEPQLSINIAGAGSVAGNGSVDQLALILEGSGDFKLSALQAKYCKVTIEGAGDAYVYATSSLDATINGSGGIYYTGQPSKVSKSINGAGEIKAQ